MPRKRSTSAKRVATSAVNSGSAWAGEFEGREVGCADNWGLEVEGAAGSWER